MRRDFFEVFNSILTPTGNSISESEKTCHAEKYQKLHILIIIWFEYPLFYAVIDGKGWFL